MPQRSEHGRVISENNYVYNFGVLTLYAGAVDTGHQSTRTAVSLGNGAFTYGTALRTGDFIDGLSNTAFFSECSGRGADGTITIRWLTKSDIVDGRAVGVTPGLMDVTAMYNACLSYTPVVYQYNYTAFGRWLEVDWGMGDLNYSDGWPFAGYDGTMYNHVATPNWIGYDCAYDTIADTPGEHAIVTARSEHPGVVNVCYGDGHVGIVASSIDLQVWRAQGTRNGGEPVSAGP